MELLARRYDTNEPVLVTIEDRLIASVEPIDEAASIIAPGLVDLQVNGLGGREFASPELTTVDVADITRTLARRGVARYCPTLTTQSDDVLVHALKTIADARRASDEIRRRTIGVHLEGPFISSTDGPRGAHPVEFCRAPDWDAFQRFQDAADGLIRIVTLAPEYETSLAFIERAVDAGLLVALGHMDAEPERIRDAISAGARMATHLGNACRPLMHRHRNTIWPQLADDRLAIGLIADGFHLPPDVLKTFIRAKSPERCVLVSDLSGHAGQPPGRYDTSLGAIEILDDGRLAVSGQRELLAGASSPLWRNVGFAMRAAGLDLSTAVDMASRFSARLLGVDHDPFAIGAPADLVTFDIDADGVPGERLESLFAEADGERAGDAS